MLISNVEIPLLTSNESAQKLLEFAEHLNIIGPVILQLTNLINSSDIQSEDKKKSIFEVESARDLLEKICQTSGHYLLDSLSIENDQLAAKLLDEGLNIAFFNVPPFEDFVEKLEVGNDSKSQFRDTLKSFPRSRIGLSLPQDISLATVIINSYRDIVGHFIYRSLNLFLKLLKLIILLDFLCLICLHTCTTPSTKQR
jgi:hypothetical protein